jgi:ankyrin repeat protein
VCVILHMSVITQNGVSALMCAAREGKTEAVVELVKAGANVDMQNKVCQYIYVVHDVHKLHVYIHVCVYMCN